MKRALLLCLALGACAEERPGQQQFDLTATADRAFFTPRGMSFKGLAGPYAVYRVTGAKPQLVGPSVTRAGGTASLLAGSRYFGGKKTAALVLRSGSHPLVGTTMAPAADGDCIVPQIPDDEPGGSSTGGSGGDAPCDMSHHEVTVEVDDAPVDSVVLLGRISLAGRAANIAEIFGKICCVGDDCSDDLPPVK
jgi:hypothetical protein